MNRNISRVTCLVAALTVGTIAQDIKVIATTQDLADIAGRIGGKLVDVESIAKGDQDIHRIVAKPQHLLKLKRADFLLQMGLDMEHAWIPALVEATHNDRIRPGGPGFVNCSTGIAPLAVPQSLDRSRGVDFHPRGNPHFNIDPEGGRIIAKNILAAFTAAYPQHADAFKANHAAFIADLDARIATWARIAEPLKGRKFVTRHSSFPYLAARYGFSIVADLEPKPGVEPTPAHVKSVIDLIKKEGVAAVIVPPYLNDGLAKRVAEDGGCKLVVLPLGVTGTAPAATYLDYLDHVISTLAKACTDSSTPPTK